MTHTASEIVRLAETMAQVQNTGALSYADKIDLLNQAYARVYDDLIAVGDNYFVKEVIVDDYTIAQGGPDLSINLPLDLYKILFVGCWTSFGELIPIPRAPGNTLSYMGYRIVGSTIRFHRHLWVGKIVIRYAPLPIQVTFTRKPEVLTGYDGRPRAAAFDPFGEKIILGYPDKLTITDCKTKEQIALSVIGPFSFAVSKQYLYVLNDTLTVYRLADVTQAGTIPNTEAYDVGFLHALGGSEEGVVLWTGVDPAEEGQSFYKASMETGVLATAPFSEGNDFDRYNYLNGVIQRLPDTSGIPRWMFRSDSQVHNLEDVFHNATSFQIADPVIFVAKPGVISGWDGLKQFRWNPTDDTGHYSSGRILAAGVNRRSGLGVIYEDGADGNVYLAGYAPDTIFDYPGNAFYDILAADLAIRFRVSLDIPSGELPGLYDDGLQTFIQTKDRDAFSPHRINNFYGRGVGRAL